MPRPHTSSRRIRDPFEDATVLAVCAVLPLTGLLFWRGLGDPFNLVKLTVGAGLALVAAGLWLVDGIRRDRVVLAPPSILAALGAFVVGLVLAVALSETPMTSVIGTYTVRGGLLSYGAGVLLFLVASSVFDARRATTFLVVVSGAVAVVAAYALLQAAGADPFTWLRSTKVFATFGNSDFASGWLGATVPLVAGAALVLPRGDWRRLATAAVAVLAVVAIPFTRSFQGVPTAAIGLAVVGAAWFLAEPDRRARLGPLVAGTGRRVGLVVGGVVVVTVVAVVSWSQLRHGMLERRYFWRAALDIAGRHPVFGTGLDTFATEFFRARPAGHAIRFSSSSAEAPHSVPLAMLANGGIVLLLTYLAVVVAVGAAFVRGLRTSDGTQRILVAAFAGSWLAYQVQSLVSLDVPPVVFLHWVVAGVGVAIAVGDRRLVYLGRDSGRRRVGTRANVATVAVAAVVVVGLVFVSRPLRADRHVVLAVEATKAQGSAGQATTIRQLQDALDLAPWEPTYRLALSSFLRSASNPAGAAEAVTKAAELDPGRPQYRLAAGELDAQVGRDAAAVRQFRRALVVDPHNPQVLVRAGSGLASLGKVEDGLVALREATRTAPDMSDAWYELGKALRRAGDDSAATKAFARATELNPKLQPPA